jgi:MYXO-CTERM domain-containing protein
MPFALAGLAVAALFAATLAAPLAGASEAVPAAEGNPRPAAASEAAGVLHGAPVTGAMDAACTSPPCGYITPIIDLVFPDKLDCGTGHTLGAEASPEDCMTPPTADHPVPLDGTIRWYWDASYEGTYPADPAQPITITFGKTSTHPAWIDFAIEPSEFVIDNLVLFNPQNLKLEEKPDGTYAVFFWFEQPVTITFTRSGEPSADDLDAMRKQDGVQQIFVKVKSTSSGTQYKEAYGIELFKFHGGNDPQVKPQVEEEAEPTPVGALVPVAALGAALYVRRRRE